MSPRKRVIPYLLIGLGFVLGLAANPVAVWLLAEGGRATGQPAAGGTKSGPKPATAATKKANAEFAKKLPFKDTQDFEDAKKGLIAPLPDKGVLKNDKGVPIWDISQYSFIKLDMKAPDTVNPSLWRQAQLL